jgi:hypothetical protein
MELAQDIIHHLSHIQCGLWVPLVCAVTATPKHPDGLIGWQWGVVGVIAFGISMEVFPAVGVKSDTKWRASVIGMLAYGTGAAIASMILVIAGR